MKNLVFLICCFFVSSASAVCGNFGNPGDGCAESISGVQTEGGDKIEITLSSTNWYSGHVCEGFNRIQFSGTDLEKSAALSIAMASYMADKGPIFFRCTEKLSYSVCGCSNIALGNTWRD